MTVPMQERLTRTDLSGAAGPYLATSWSFADDGMTLAMELRQGVKFHDGTDFDSADVVYTFNRLLDPEFDSSLLSLLKAVDSVEAAGSHTVNFNLNKPDADLPTAMTEWKMNMFAEGSADTIAETGNGTGPFKLSVLDIEGTSEMVPFDGYWG
jgi:peptide/nickel transport system substrate-binding protein